MIKGGSGSTLANHNGLIYEKKTSLKTILSLNGYTLNPEGKFYLEGLEKPLQHIQGTQFYKFIRETLQADLNKVSLSHTFRPDIAIYNPNSNKIIVIEQKYQERDGSVDEKIQNSPYKKHHYQRALSTTDTEFELAYILNDWFKQKKYKDVIQYMLDSGIKVGFNTFDLDILK